MGQTIATYRHIRRAIKLTENTFGFNERTYQMFTHLNIDYEEDHLLFYKAQAAKLYETLVLFRINDFPNQNVIDHALEAISKLSIIMIKYIEVRTQFMHDTF